MLNLHEISLCKIPAVLNWGGKKVWKPLVEIRKVDVSRMNLNDIYIWQASQTSSPLATDGTF